MGTSLPAVIKGYATLRDAKLTESSWDKVVMWTGGSYDNDDVMRALVRLDRPEMRLGTRGQSGKTIPTYFTDPEVDAPRIVPVSARTERRRSPAMERSPSRAWFLHLPTIVRRKLKRMRYRRYHCRLDQLSDMLGTGLFERISILRRSPEVSLTPDGVQVAEIGDRMKRWSIQQLKQRARCARCRKLGHWARECTEGNRGQHYDERYDRLAWRSEENVHRCTRATRNGDLSFLGHHGHSSPLTLEKSCGTLVPRRGSSENSNLTNGVNCLRSTVSSQEKPESASGIGGPTQPIGVENVPVGLVGRHGIIRFTVVEQEVPPL